MRMRLFLWLGFLALAGCSTLSVSKALDQVHPGIDKDRVLESAGNPQRTFRENMQDHWIYTYFLKDKEWRRDVIFEDGKVVKVTQPAAKENWVKDLERTDSMEEYETKAREHQKKAGQFKSIDGQPEDPSSPN
jgi:outer membrane protein assembly factor BamE (lipoprotein component of BamABCDE complex)